MADEMTKIDRNRLIKSEVYLQLAVTAERWAAYLDAPVNPIETWPKDDPLRVLLDRYNVEPTELAHLIRKVAGALETKTITLGYDQVPL